MLSNSATAVLIKDYSQDSGVPFDAFCRETSWETNIWLTQEMLAKVETWPLSDTGMYTAKHSSLNSLMSDSFTYFLGYKIIAILFFKYYKTKIFNLTWKIRFYFGKKAFILTED